MAARMYMYMDGFRKFPQIQKIPSGGPDNIISGIDVFHRVPCERPSRSNWIQGGVQLPFELGHSISRVINPYIKAIPVY